MAILAGEFATANRVNEEIGVATTDTQDTAGTSTSTSFTATLTGGTACGLAFVAPPSGKVMIYNNCDLKNSGALFTACGIRVRTGSTIGSGSDVLAISFQNTVLSTGTAQTSACRTKLLTGLTAGSSYNVQQLFVVGGGTGTFAFKNLIVHPQL